MALSLIAQYYKALSAPYTAKNRQHALLIPAALFGMVLLLMLLFGITTVLLLMSTEFQPVYGILTLILTVTLMPIGVLAIVCAAVTLLGYQWRIASVWLSKGFEAPLPRWTIQEWRKTFLTGMHGVGFLMIFVGIGVLLHQGLGIITGFEAQAAAFGKPAIGDFRHLIYPDAEISWTNLIQAYGWVILSFAILMVFVTPFVIGPLLYNAQSPQLGGILVSLFPAWKWTLQCYGRLLPVTLFWVFGVGTVSLFMVLLLGMSLIGFTLIPFVIMAAFLSLTSLYVVAFGG